LNVYKGWKRVVRTDGVTFAYPFTTV